MSAAAGPLQQDDIASHSVDCFLFSPNEQRAGGDVGGALPDFFFFLFSPCSADHERDWPPCKVVFFGLATNALNVRNNNKGAF